MTPLIIIAAVAGFGMVIGVVMGLCEAAAQNERLDDEEARTIAAARGITDEFDAIALSRVEYLEHVYALPSRMPGHGR